MIPWNDTGAAARLLCLSLAVAVLASCARAPAAKAPDDALEVQQLIEATKANPSLQPGSNEAGPPIHVDPYPRSAGMAHHDESPHH